MFENVDHHFSEQNSFRTGVECLLSKPEKMCLQTPNVLSFSETLPFYLGPKAESCPPPLPFTTTISTSRPPIPRFTFKHGKTERPTCQYCEVFLADLLKTLPNGPQYLCETASEKLYTTLRVVGTLLSSCWLGKSVQREHICLDRESRFSLALPPTTHTHSLFMLFFPFQRRIVCMRTRAFAYICVRA